jgi:hypothetical protein
MVLYAKMIDGREIEQASVISVTVQDGLMTALLDSLETFCVDLSLVERVNIQSA